MASASSVSVHGARADSANPVSRLDSVNLPSHLVAYQAPVTPTTTPTTTTPTTEAPVTSHLVPAPTPTTTPTTQPAPVTPTTVVTASGPAYSENGQATWYSEAPAGKCASPTLPFGTVLTVRNDATGATTTCTVDDREESPYPRVVDMSYSGFSQIADPSQGVVDVTISW